MSIKECNSTPPRLQDTYSNRRKSRRKVFCAIELGVGNLGLSQGGRRREKRREGNKSEWKREGGREGGRLLMGFDGRQSYERVATQSDSAAAVEQRGMIFALISYSATIVR